LHPELVVLESSVKLKIVGTHLNLDDELKTTMNIPKQLIDLARKLAISVL